MNITNINMTQLLEALKANTREILEHIQQDEDLAKQQVDDLIIANAGPGLIEPKKQHQLYAKGIVYTPEMELVSLPLLKFYNHNERQINIDYTRQLNARDDVTYTCMEKLDGSMIQAFTHDGRVHLTTRSRLTNPHRADRFSFHDEARAILQRDAPHVLDPQWVGSKTLIFELVSPGNRQYTNYHGLSAMILTSVFDDWRYWTSKEVLEAASQWSLQTAKMLSQHPHMDAAIEEAYATLDQDEALSPEGFVVNFEQQTDEGARLVHRSKVKTPSYKALRRTIDDFSKRNLFRLLVHRADLRQWDALEAAMTALYESRGQRGFDDARRKNFVKHFDTFNPWFERVEQAYTDAVEQVPRYYEANPPEDTSDYHREFAIYHKTHFPESFGHIIRHHKTGRISWQDVVESYLKGVK